MVDVQGSYPTPGPTGDYVPIVRYHVTKIKSVNDDSFALRPSPTSLTISFSIVHFLITRQPASSWSLATGNTHPPRCPQDIASSCPPTIDQAVTVCVLFLLIMLPSHQPLISRTTALQGDKDNEGRTPPGYLG